jgi:hypothetical protein
MGNTVKFSSLGQVAITRGVTDRITEDELYNNFVEESLKRYVSGDWGDLGEADKALNDWAINPENQPERVLARYNYPGDKTRDIFIITEWDRSVTTILHPSEY